MFSSIVKMVAKTKFFVTKNSPQILMGIGCVSMVSAVISAARSTLKFQQVLDEHDAMKFKQEEVEGMLKEGKISEKDYTPEDRKNDKIKIYTTTAIGAVKCYAMPIMLTVLAGGCFLSANGILNKRYLGAATALAATLNEKKALETRFIEEYGADKLEELKHGKQVVVGRTEHIDESGNTVCEDILDKSKDSIYSPFMFFFDATSPNWEKDPEANRTFLWQQQRFLNMKLQGQGYLFLNDVRKALGFEPTQSGQIVGWVYNKSQKDFVDFGIFDENDNWKRRFINGLEAVVAIEPNVSGPILDIAGLEK